MHKNLAAVADVEARFQGAVLRRQAAAVQGIDCGWACCGHGGRVDTIGFVAQLQRLAACAHKVGAEGGKAATYG